MSKKVLGVIAIIVLLTVFYFVFIFNKKQGVALGANASSNTQSITLAEVSNHNNLNDCWLVIANKVYDVTKFIPKHPGKDRILMGCGKDATDLFTGKSQFGRVHSEVAKKMLESYHIGTLTN